MSDAKTHLKALLKVPKPASFEPISSSPYSKGDKKYAWKNIPMKQSQSNINYLSALIIQNS